MSSKPLVITLDECRAVNPELNVGTVHMTLNLWLAVLRDAPLRNPNRLTKEIDRGMEYWRNYFATTPFTVICEAMKRFGDTFLKSLYHSSAASKAVCIDWFTKLPIIRYLVIDIFAANANWDDLYPVDQQRIAYYIQYVITMFHFGVKAHYQDESFRPTLVESWFANESRLANVVLNRKLIRFLRDVNAWLMPCFVDMTLLPSQSSGAVSNPKSKGLTGKLKYWRDIPESVWKNFFHSTKRRTRRYKDIGWTPARALNYDPPYCVVPMETLNSKFSVAAKNALTGRGIATEPAEMMSWQHGVLRMFVTTFEQTKISRFVTLEEQDNNRRHALVASKDDLSTTVDQKDASDNILRRLVRGIFPKQIWDAVDAVRTPFLLIDDYLVEPVKMSPMGSATCFPVQTLIFLTVAIASHLVHFFNEQTFGTPRTRVPAIPGDWDLPKIIQSIDKVQIPDNESFWTWIEQFIHANPTNRDTRKYMCLNGYGDDIIIDNRVYDIFRQICNAVGFVVNVDKTFGQGLAIKESCGIYAFKGYDVTPIKFKCPHIPTERKDPKILQSLIDLANRSAIVGFRNLRNQVISECIYGDYHQVPKHHGINCVRFSNNVEESSSIYTFNHVDKNWHLPTRLNEPLSYADVLKKYKIVKDSDWERVPSYIRWQRNEMRTFRIERRRDPLVKTGDKALTRDAYSHYGLSLAKKRQGNPQKDDQYLEDVLSRLLSKDHVPIEFTVLSHSDDYVITKAWEALVR